MSIKQVILIRRDLNMSPGKLAAQACHASIKAFLSNAIRAISCNVLAITLEASDWEKNSSTKVVLGVDTEEELLRYFAKAKTAGLPCSLILDEGRTELKGENFTAVGIGPAKSDLINEITGKLRLL